MVIRYAALCLAAVLLCLPSPAAAMKKDKQRRSEDAINYSLGVEYTQWLNGPTFYIATEAERAELVAGGSA